jgi:ELWxxDGT repeat protein
MNRQLLSTFVVTLLPLAASPAQNLVRDLTPATASTVGGNPGTAVICNGIAYFAAADLYGRELWCTDGTDLGTFRLRDINPGAASSDPQLLTVAGNRVFFTARHEGQGRELWVTDGTSATTHLVVDLASGTNVGADITSMVAWNGLVFFAAPTAGNGSN